MIMNFLSNQNGILNVETDLNKLTRLAEAVKDAIPAQDYEYKVNDLEALLKELHKVIVAGAQAIAHDAQVAQELAEYREKKASREGAEARANIEAKRAS
tara:strand:- start:103 stop:399 length:297 start_codon:yes stop_codon:yes gene_type:complete